VLGTVACIDLSHNQQPMVPTQLCDQQLLWRGTFIDGWSEAHDAPRRRRSYSEHVQGCSDMAQELFAAEQEYLRTLSSRAPHLESHCGVSRLRVDSVVFSREPSTGTSDSEGVPSSSSPYCQPKCYPPPTAASPKCPRQSCAHGPSEDDLDVAAMNLSRPGLPQVSAHGQPQGPPAAALSELQQVSKMPEDDVQQLTLHILGDVQPQAAGLSGRVLMVSGGTAPDESVECAIEQTAPLGGSAVEMKRMVQHYVAPKEEGICNQSESCGRGNQMAWHVEALPADIRATTLQAFGSALEESRSQAAWQMDHAAASLPWAAELAEGKGWPVSSLPLTVPDSFSHKATSVATQTLQQTAGSWPSALPTGAQRAASSEVGAGAFLHAEDGQAPMTTAIAPVGSSGAGLASAWGTTSIGSKGHPFLCVRPCIYFAQGRCSSGSSCSYCHDVHEFRPAHLDKSGRETLRKLTFKQRVSVALPVLRQVADSQGFGTEAAELFAALEASARTMPGPATPPPAVLPSHLRQKLLRSLRSLNFRAVLTHVCREDAPEGLQRTALFDIMARIAESKAP